MRVSDGQANGVERQHVDAGREMAAWRLRVHLKAGGVQEGVVGDFYFGALQRPRRVVHLESAKAVARGVGVEAVAFCGPVFERRGSGGSWVSNWAIAGAEDGGRVRAEAGEVESIVRAAELHARAVVGKIEEAAAGENGGARCGVETEEPDAGFAVGNDVGAHVDLRERGKEGSCRESPGPDGSHAKRHDSDPSGTIEGVGRKAGGEVWAEGDRADLIMDEGEIEPRHGDGPRAAREWPGAVVGDAKKVGDVHGVLV